MDADKFRRMRKAALTEEDPLVQYLIEKGVPSRKNKSKATQRAHGDVFMTFTDGSTRSIEVQVSDKYVRSSYSLHKVAEYVGPGLPEHAYTMLGCLKANGKPEMFYVIVQAVQLHNLILSDPNRFLSHDHDYYLIDLGDLHDLEGVVACGNSIKELVQEFLLQLAN